MNDKLFNLTQELFSKVLNVPILLDVRLPVYNFETTVLSDSFHSKTVIIKVFRRKNWMRNFGVYIPTFDQFSWYEIDIRDEVPNGAWFLEKIRHSEAHAIEEFLRTAECKRIAGFFDEDYYCVLGNEKQIEKLIQLAMEENYKKGRKI